MTLPKAMLIDLDDTPAAGPHRRVGRWLWSGIAT
jgi:hypothetical protein